MSHIPPHVQKMDIPPLHTIFQQEVERQQELLIKKYPKHGTRKPLTWTFVSWELQVSEQTVRNYIDQNKLKNLKIPTLAEFIVLENIRESIAEDKKLAKQKK